MTKNILLFTLLFCELIFSQSPSFLTAEKKLFPLIDGFEVVNRDTILNVYMKVKTSTGTTLLKSQANSISEIYNETGLQSVSILKENIVSLMEENSEEIEWMTNCGVLFPLDQASDNMIKASLGRSISINDNSGSVYGKLEIVPHINFDSVKVSLLQTNQSLTPDCNGTYYFESVQPGTYKLKIDIPVLGSFTTTDIVVYPDTITVVIQNYHNRQINNQSNKILVCNTIKRKKLSPLKFGSISGYVYDIDKNPAINTEVILFNTFWLTNWLTKTDSTGFFEINKILPGEYKIFSSNNIHYIAESEVIIFPDSTINTNLYIDFDRSLDMYNPDR